MSTRSSQQEGLVTLLVTLIAIGATLPVFLLGAFGTSVMSSLRFHAGLLGVAAASYTVGMALTSLFLGRQLDKLSLFAGVGLATACGVGGAVVTFQASSLWVLLVGLLLAGTASGGFQMTAGRILNVWVRDESRGGAYGWFQSSKPLAVSVAGMLAITGTGGGYWRWAFLGVALATAGLALWLAFLSRQGVQGPPGGPRGKVRPPGRRRIVFSLALLMGVGFGIANISTTFLPQSASLFGEDLNVGVILVLGGVLAAGTRIGVGKFVDKSGWDELIVIAPAFVLAGAGCLFVATGYVPLAVLGAVLIFSFGWAVGGAVVSKGVRNNRVDPGSSMGSLLLGGAVGGTLFPPVFGFVATTSNYRVAWTVLGLLVVSVGLVNLVVVLNRRVRRIA